jgi:hypothetical protein
MLNRIVAGEDVEPSEEEETEPEECQVCRGAGLAFRNCAVIAGLCEIQQEPDKREEERCVIASEPFAP